MVIGAGPAGLAAAWAIGGPALIRWLSSGPARWRHRGGRGMTSSGSTPIGCSLISPAREFRAGTGRFPRRVQDANVRGVQRLAFWDLSGYGYPRSDLGAFTRVAADGVTVAVDDGFVRALKTGRVTMKPAVDRIEDGNVRFADGSACAPDVVICATGYRPALESLVGHLVTLDEAGMPPFTGPSASPHCPGLWFFGLDRSICGNMHVHRGQAGRLARMISRQPGPSSSS